MPGSSLLIEPETEIYDVAFFVVYAGKGEIEEDDLKAATISWMHEIRVRVFSWSAGIVYISLEASYFAR